MAAGVRGRDRRPGRVVTALVGGLLVAGLSGCGGDGSLVPGYGGDDGDPAGGESGDEGGFGLPVQPEGGVAGERGPLSGTFAVEGNGCFSLVTDDGVHHWVLWPRGAQHDGAQVLLADGAAVTDGAAVEATGLLAPAAEALPDFANPDSYFGAFGRFCEAEAADVAVLDSVTLP